MMQDLMSACHIKDYHRDPSEVMVLARMGASFPTRLSFMPSLLRRLHSENWVFSRPIFEMDDQGFGHAVYQVSGPKRTYSLVVFTQDLKPEERTDRVIAEKWDATFNLFDGVPTSADIERLSKNTPLQEAGRFSQTELVLGRANRSIRLFSHIVDALASGEQPDLKPITDVGYLMRTTAVYGSGKFGCADRFEIGDREELRTAFHVEMLAVYLFRWFTIDLVEYMAKLKAPLKAVALTPDIRDYLGVGNSTGLGMAPFIVKYPALIHQWVKAKECALANVRAQASADASCITHFYKLLDQAEHHIHEWDVDDEIQQNRIVGLRRDLRAFKEYAECFDWQQSQPWNYLFVYASDHYELEAQELIVSLLIEPHGHLVDGFADNCYANSTNEYPSHEAVSSLLILLKEHYQWAFDIDFTDPVEHASFWYYSEDKLEPRLALRAEEPGSDLEMPLAIGRDINHLKSALETVEDQSLAQFLALHPEFRQLVKRVYTVRSAPYGEIRDNLIHKGIRPIDLLRFKLAFFGASKFDPKSDRWTRITMYQGAPHPLHLAARGPENWFLPIEPKDVA